MTRDEATDMMNRLSILKAEGATRITMAPDGTITADFPRLAGATPRPAATYISSDSGDTWRETSTRI